MIPLSFKTKIFNEKHYLFDTFIRFHTNQLQGNERYNAKMILFPIHYSTLYDMTYAWDVVEKKRKELNSRNICSSRQ